MMRLITTDDGWRVAIHHYRPARPRRRHAVVCCHGLGANQLVFDAGPGTSLARHLAERGYDVFTLDLRGHGASDRPRLLSGERRFGWSFDDYLLRDLPAAIRGVLDLTGGREVHWIGHSMGGLLLYALLANGDAPIRSGIVVGSSVDMSAFPSSFHALLRFDSLLERVPAIPIGIVSRLASLAVGRWISPFETMNVWSSNVDAHVWRRVCRHGFHTISSPVLAQLASALREGGLASREGIAYMRGLARATTPVLAIAGDRDVQVPPDAVRRTVERLASPRKELRVFGPEHGHVDHYGHFDLLIGRRARDEVFPHVERWLDEHDA